MKLTDMLNSEPPLFNKNKSFQAYETWQKLKPLIVEDILMFSEQTIESLNKDNQIEFKDFKCSNYLATGQFKKGTNFEQGIVRVIS